MKYFFLFLLFLYKALISPFLGKRCRFYPSCSDYSRECFHRFSIFKALWYTALRLSKCHPFHPGGFDYVPEDTEIKGHHVR